MRKCLSKFSRMFECGAVQKCVHHVDIVKSFQSIQTSIQCLLAKFGFDTADNGPLKVCQQLLPLFLVALLPLFLVAKSQKTFRKSIAWLHSRGTAGCRVALLNNKKQTCEKQTVERLCCRGTYRLTLSAGYQQRYLEHYFPIEKPGQDRGWRSFCQRHFMEKLFFYLLRMCDLRFTCRFFTPNVLPVFMGAKLSDVEKW